MTQNEPLKKYRPSNISLHLKKYCLFISVDVEQQPAPKLFKILTFDLSVSLRHSAPWLASCEFLHRRRRSLCFSWSTEMREMDWRDTRGWSRGGWSTYRRCSQPQWACRDPVRQSQGWTGVKEKNWCGQSSHPCPGPEFPLAKLKFT